MKSLHHGTPRLLSWPPSAIGLFSNSCALPSVGNAISLASPITGCFSASRDGLRLLSSLPKTFSRVVYPSLIVPCSFFIVVFTFYNALSLYLFDVCLTLKLFKASSL